MDPLETIAFARALIDIDSTTGREREAGDWLAGVLQGTAEADRPVTEYAHVPLVLNAEGRRLAKRDGAVTLEDLGVLDGPDSPDTEPAPWTADRVRTVLLESVGLPGESLDAALDAFAPDRLPRTPWIFTGLD